MNDLPSDKTSEQLKKWQARANASQTMPDYIEVMNDLAFEWGISTTHALRLLQAGDDVL